MTAHLRHMQPQDAEQVSALMMASWLRTFGPLMGEERARAETAARHNPDALKADLTRPHSESFVAETAAGDIVGYAFATIVAGRLSLERLHVLPVAQGSGVAAGLIHAVIANFIGEPAISLEVFAENRRAVRFYEREGFIVTERRERGEGFAGLPCFVMTKAISRA